MVAYVRRRSNAFSRGKSRFRGVSGQEGRWESRIGRYGGRKNVCGWVGGRGVGGGWGACNPPFLS